MSEYTPTTDQIRRAYRDGLSGTSRTQDEVRGEFDRWLAEVERAAAEKAWDACLTWMPFDLDWKIQFGDLNPYRKVPSTGEGNDAALPRENDQG